MFAPAQALASCWLLLRVTFLATHFQGGFAYRDWRLEMIRLSRRQEAQFRQLRLETGTRYLIPRLDWPAEDGDPRAGFAIADMEHGVVEFAVPYDIQSGSSEQSRIAEPLALRLAFGH
jgi:hypothetical protein